MKLATHPLVVAVALGLLPAHALAEDEERDDRSVPPCADCPDADLPGDASSSPVAPQHDAAIAELLGALQSMPSPKDAPLD